MTTFTKIYRLAWLGLIILLISLDRTNLYWTVLCIVLLILLTVIAVFRVLESRNEWRKYIKEENIDEKLSENKVEI